MKISYIVLAHKNITQIHSLLKAIEGKNVFIYLHIDLLAGKNFYNEAVKKMQGINNLTFLKRYATTWGSFGLVSATLEGIHQINEKKDSDYTILLSGQDYPVKSPVELESFLKKNTGKSFLEYYQFPHPYWIDQGGFDRITRWYFTFPFKENRFLKCLRTYLNQAMNIIFPRRKFPYNFLPYGGSQWWCLFRDCVSYIEDFSENHPLFMNFFKTVRIPDEIIFHTILMNSELSRNIENRRLTYVDWNGPPYPRVLSKSEIALLKSSEYFFARKFESADTSNVQ